MFSKLAKNYSVFIIRLSLILTLTLIGYNVCSLFYSTLTGNNLNAIFSTVMMILLIKVNKEVQ